MIAAARWGAALALLVPGAGFHSRPDQPETLTVFAAASLTDAFGELGRTLERDQPGLQLRFNFAGSQQLAAQLEQGAKADVFASADQRWMSYIAERGLLGQPPQLFARNRLVVIVPQTNPARITRLEHLARRGVKLVLAAEAVPAGNYSREALRNLAAAPGFADRYATRALANVVSQEENVKAVAAKVQLGEADAGMVYRSDVTPALVRYVRVLDIPDRYNVLASYPMAVLRGAPNPAAARTFLRLALSPAGQRILQRHGLLPVASAESVGATPQP